MYGSIYLHISWGKSSTSSNLKTVLAELWNVYLQMHWTKQQLQKSLPWQGDGWGREIIISISIIKAHIFECFHLQFSSVTQSCATLCESQWTTAGSLSISNSRSLLKLMSIESMMPSNHLILCRSLLPPSIFPSFRGFSNESVLRIR